MDALRARLAVARPLDRDGSKDGLHHASMQAPVGIWSWLLAVLV